MALVRPEGEPCVVLGMPELDAGEAVLVPLEVGEAVIEPRRPDRPRPAEVVLGTVDRLRPRRDAAPVGPQDRPARGPEDDVIHEGGPHGQVGVRAASEGAGIGADVLRRRPDPQAVP